MVIFQRQNQTQSSMPRSNTLLRHFQNAQDELLAHNWTRAMTYDNREPMVQQASHGAGGAARAGAPPRARELRAVWRALVVWRRERQHHRRQAKGVVEADAEHTGIQGDDEAHDDDGGNQPAPDEEEAEETKEAA